ncbi:MAG: NgoFVII family restriction endonuclease [Campylobacterales bacterium]|nr:NgoFVII family restriction endonuclease [Campylobacterales bacterium]
MSFYDNQPIEQKDRYKEYLQIVGSLSNLFSDSATPYLYYRIAEKMFCKAFEAKDLSRGDVSYDAQKMSLGIGLKTFLRGNDKSLQKIAEFNRDRELYYHLSSKEKIEKIAQLRNARLKFTNNLYNIDDSIYHCVIRDKGRFFIFEEETKKIDIESISDVKVTNSAIAFNDGIYEYSFSLSKSTLMKRFETTIFKDSFEVKILEDPLEALYSLVNQDKKMLTANKMQETIYLPLYGRDGMVYSSSGLNQWNAKGRVRHPDEVYIPVPKEFHDYKPNFFPNRDTIFTLRLPNGETMEAKLCQENSKALMSNPNRALGKWLLRDLFKLKEGELMTNDTLKLYGIDSVRIDKMNDLEYEINFAKIDSYERFIESFK